MGRLEALLIELRKRKVFRAAAAYGIVAFAVLQVSEPILHGLQLPDWVLSVVVVLLLLAFPVAMVLAWIFDFGPAGIERTGASRSEAPPAAPSTPASPFPPPARRPWARKPTWAVVALLAGGAAALGAWQLAPRDTPPSERITVAVADFANGTSDPELDGLSTMLITALEQSRHVAVLTRTRMHDLLRQMGREPVERIDEPLGRELAVRAGARALLTASVHRFDRTYAIEMKVLDPATARYLFAAKEEGNGKGSVPGMIDRLGDRVRRALRERDEEIRRSRVEVGTAVTGDLGALAHYVRGERLADRGDFPGAVDAFESAIAVDPDFGLAHYQIAYLAEFGGATRERQERALAAATRLAPRLPEKERLLVQAWAAHHEGRGAEARALYGRALEVAPDDKEALYLSGDLHHHAGDLAGAVPFLERVLALDPGWTPAVAHLVPDLGQLGRRDEMLAVAERAARARPDENTRWLVEARLLRGEPEEARAEAVRHASGGDPQAILLLLDVLLGQERLAEGEEQARRLHADGVAPDDRVEGWHGLAKVSMLRGRDSEALVRLRAATRESASRSRVIHAWEALLELAIPMRSRADLEASLRALQALGAPVYKWAPRLALYGEGERARALAAEMPPGEILDLWTAVERWQQGDPAAAEAVLRQREQRYPLARLLAEQGRDAEVVETLRGALGSTWQMVSNVWTVPRSRVLLARSLHRLGREDEARAELVRFREPLDHPDPGWPPLAEARALERELGRGDRAAAAAPPSPSTPR